MRRSCTYLPPTTISTTVPSHDRISHPRSVWKTPRALSLEKRRTTQRHPTGGQNLPNVFAKPEQFLTNTTWNGGRFWMRSYGRYECAGFELSACAGARFSKHRSKNHSLPECGCWSGERRCTTIGTSSRLGLERKASRENHKAFYHHLGPRAPVQVD